MRALLISAAGLVSVTSAYAADYRMTLTDIGQRDYYCTITVELENLSGMPLDDINGYFLSYVGEEEVGRSKGASFLNVGPGGRVSAIFETPNAPCTADTTDVTRYRFFVGACRISQSFVDRAACAAQIETIMPIASAAGR